MLKGLGDVSKMMKAAQEMQGKMEALQAELDDIKITGESGAGLVRVIVTAKNKITGIDIDPSILHASEKDVVEDLIVAALSDAQQKAAERSQEKMRQLTEGLGLPAGMKLPF